MSIWNAVLLGFVQGVAEFLPISSSGHLSIIYNLFNLTPLEDGHMLFSVLLRLATLISILIVYWNDILAIVYELLSFANAGPLAGQPCKYRGTRLLVMIIISVLPMLFIIPLRAQLNKLFYRNVFIGVMIILTGFMLYTSDRMTPGKKTERSMTMFDALIIGLCQCAAAIPGLSRSCTTITAGVATGLRRDFAVKFSMLMSLPAVVGSLLLNLIDTFKSGVDWSCIPAYLVGTAVALVSGIAAINVLKYISAKGKFGKFAYYCWVVGVLGIILTMIF